MRLPGVPKSGRGSSTGFGKAAIRGWREVTSSVRMPTAHGRGSFRWGRSMFDLLIRGGRVLDPAAGIDAPLDLGVRAGRIAAVGPRLEGPAAETIEAGGLLVTP